MKRGSTLFLKIVLVLLALAAAGLYLFWLPGIAARVAAADPEIAHLSRPFLIYVLILAIPFFAALYQAFRLLTYIDANRAFSEASVRAVGNIKVCALVIIALVALVELYASVWMQGSRLVFLVLGIFLIFATSVVATFAAVLQSLLQNAVAIQSENDLTV
jgi:hypothetical protein